MELSWARHKLPGRGNDALAGVRQQKHEGEQGRVKRSAEGKSELGPSLRKIAGRALVGGEAKGKRRRKRQTSRGLLQETTAKV